MSRRLDVARAAVCTAALLWLAACSGQNANPAPTPAQALKARLAAFVGAHSVALDGTLSLESQTYHVTFNEDEAFRAEGTVTANQQQVVAHWTGEQLFLRSGDYFDAQQLYVGNRWVLTRSDKLQALVTKLANRKELADALVALAGPNVAQHAADAIGGVKMVQLSTDRVTVTVPAAGGAPVRLATAVDQPLSDGLSDLKLTVTASAAPAAIPTPPTSYVDLANLNTLPSNFEQVSLPADSFRFEGCDRRGCTLGVDFHNLGGRVGASTATFYVLRGTDRVGSCTAPIPPTDHGGTVRVSCRVNWDTTVNDAQGNVDITNPE